MNRINYIIAVGCMLILVGCDSFLDRSPISNANENIFYKSEDDFLVATDAAYNSLYTLYGPESLPSFFGELMSDNAYSDNNIGNVKDYEAFDTHVGMDPSNSLVLGFWNSYYEAIYIINNILSKSNSVDFDLKLSLQAEVRFLRALYYFDMVRAWGDVPLVVKPLSVAEALQQPRTPQEQVYEAIIEDLQFAAKNLPDKKNERFVGAANEDAANTLLGKVYLTIGDKGKAEESLLKVYGKFSLVPYGDLWDTAKKNGVESIFEIQYMGGEI